MRYFVSNQPSQAQIDHSLDQFAEYLSQDLELPAIAHLMQVSIGTTCVLLRLLCERFGEQAR